MHNLVAVHEFQEILNTASAILLFNYLRWIDVYANMYDR